jgi:hypothetical protein
LIERSFDAWTANICDPASSIILISWVIPLRGVVQVWKAVVAEAAGSA